MSDNIPYEIQMEIIKKVSKTMDVKSLIRFRSVSKQWLSFIDSHEFIAFYGVRQTQPHRLLLRYKEINNPREFKLTSVIDDVTFPQQQDFAPNVSNNLVKLLKYSQVIGSSCGLWCFTFHSYRSKTRMVVIWNPSISKSVGIVMPHVLNNSPISLDQVQFTTLGFGVCPSTNDPTIVVIMSYIEKALEMGGINNIPWQVKVFTLSSKTWKMIPTSNLPRVSVRLDSTQVATDRFIFWVANDIVSQFKSLILSFDLITHAFKEINLPDSIANKDISISKLNESLVVSAFTDEVNGILVYSVWMMGEEGGVMTSFKKLFDINRPDLVISKVLGCKKSGEPIMETVREDQKLFAVLEVYEPCSEHITNLGINGEFNSFFICPYMETLLLADHSDGYIFPNNY